ncbi:MAG TPA: hypothetical protein VI727_07740 [Candidatus Brocadiaceae bacterium]|nr:hypothetical protein [Candidatus Brocadiaceae bacterium]
MVQQWKCYPLGSIGNAIQVGLPNRSTLQKLQSRCGERIEKRWGKKNPSGMTLRDECK